MLIEIIEIINYKKIKIGIIANANSEIIKEPDKYYPIIVRIEYELVDPSSGVYFNMPDPEAAPYVIIIILYIYNFFFFFFFI